MIFICKEPTVEDVKKIYDILGINRTENDISGQSEVTIKISVGSKIEVTEHYVVLT